MEYIDIARPRPNGEAQKLKRSMIRVVFPLPDTHVYGKNEYIKKIKQWLLDAEGAGRAGFLAFVGPHPFMNGVVYFTDQDDSARFILTWGAVDDSGDV